MNNGLFAKAAVVLVALCVATSSLQRYGILDHTAMVWLLVSEAAAFAIIMSVATITGRDRFVVMSLVGYALTGLATMVAVAFAAAFIYRGHPSMVMMQIAVTVAGMVIGLMIFFRGMRLRNSV